MDWADWTLLLLPQWLLVVFSAAVFLLGVRAWRCGESHLVDGRYLLAIGAAFLSVTLFYIGALTNSYADSTHAVAASRFVFLAQSIIVGLVLALICNKAAK